MKKTKNITIRITEDQLKRLVDQIILTEGLSMSNIVREALNEKLEKLEKHGHRKIK